ncbi:hypothetical protein CEXT_381211 [Caerostris extrusa]|uniref:Secreted protein n=1 Tax=Caerostris extrusa TaxID=172846 RepID=A0AAV4WTD0_CAEEX|nr:hypothetical protein CEXT_381211 [Caerostris extrusa]
MRNRFRWMGGGGCTQLFIISFRFPLHTHMFCNSIETMQMAKIHRTHWWGCIHHSPPLFPRHPPLLSKTSAPRIVICRGAEQFPFFKPGRLLI